MNKNTSPKDHRLARQTAILDAVSKESISTQNDLVRSLRRRGITATQVSVSRDIAEMGLIKAGGKYRAGAAEGGLMDSEMPLRVWVRHAAPAGPHLAVVRCDSGTAQRVAFVLDGLAMPGVVGTIAGDDTVFVAVASADAGKRIVEFLQSRMKNNETT